jgi:hypothetical protein
LATPEQTAALAAALRGQQRPTTADMGVYGLVTAPDEEDARMQAAAMAQALRGQRAAGHLGLLTGDRVLSGFGQAQMQGADRQEGMLADAGQFRSSNVLKQALAAEEAKRQNRLDTERERHNRNMEGRPPSNVFLQGPGGQYFMGSTRGDGPVVPVVDPTNNPVFSPKADDIKTAEEKAIKDAEIRNVDLENKYRTELQGLPHIKEYQMAGIGLDKVRNAAGRIQASIGAKMEPTPADDIALIFGYMKTIDPTSVVRETEFATAQNAAGVPDRIRNMWNNAKNGTRLTPEQRQEFISSAESQFQAYESKANATFDGYRKLATDSGLDPDRIILGGTRINGAGPKQTTPALPAGKSSTRPTTTTRAPMPAGELGGEPTQEAGGGVVTEAMGRGFRPLNVGLPPFAVNPEKMRARSGGIYMFNPDGAAFFVKDATIKTAREKGWKDAQ